MRVRLERENLDKLIGIHGFLNNLTERATCKVLRGMHFKVAEILNEEKIANIDTTTKIPNIEKEGIVIFVLVKYMWDTNRVLRSISHQLKIPFRCIKVCGLKDKNALTAQFVSIKGISAKELYRIRLKNVWINNVEYADKMLKRGGNLGNMFNIELELIEREYKDLPKFDSKIIYFPNFYGYQRFGTRRPITHIVGKYIVKGDLEKAVKAYIALPFDRESSKARKVREKMHENFDPEYGLKHFPKYLVEERIMLRHLRRRRDDYYGALLRLGKNMIRLFVEAYQSYIFNRLLSTRLDLGSLLRPTEGDITTDLYIPGKKLKVIALPLIGTKTKRPQGKLGAIYERILRDEGIDENAFKTIFGEFKGAYRNAVSCAWDVSFVRNNNKIIAKFSLPRGSYALIFLREFFDLIIP